MKSSEKIVCQICGKELKNVNSLSRHLGYFHKNIILKDYYDKYLKQENENICQYCNKKTNYRNMVRGYLDFCSRKCASLGTRDKTRETWMKIYGVDHPNKCKEVIEKSKQTYFKRTGFENSSHNPDVIEKRKQTYFKRTGFYYPMQNPESFEKNKKSAYSSKPYSMPSGDIRFVQGYEHFALNFLIESYDESNILTHKGVPTIVYDFEDGNHTYYPDIFIPSENLIIEVKSTWTYTADLDKNLAKQQACSDQEYDFMFMIFDKNGNLVN